MTQREAARLIMPAIRWGGEGQLRGQGQPGGFEPALETVDQGHELGVGGFIVFGGERKAVRDLADDVRRRAKRPMLIASDFERGPGQQVKDLTALPPLLALAQLGDDAIVEAARITAREALDVGVTWVFAPVCDLDIEPANPIVQTRALGADAFNVGHLAALWIRTCQAEGVLACAKHFPGHGRTTIDSHAAMPVVHAGNELGRDILPFRRAVEAGVASVMTAHVAYPGWDKEAGPATFSNALITGLLRKDLFFDGLVVTDALIMEGARLEGAEGGEAAGARRVIEAGGDVLLYPHDPEAALRGLDGVNVRPSLDRLDAAIARTASPAPLDDLTLARHRQRGRDLAYHAVQCLRGEPPERGGGWSVAIVDDDAGGPYPLPPRDVFAAQLGAGKGGARTVVLLFADVKGWKGRAGISEESAAKLARLVDRPDPPLVIVFGHPRRVADVPGDGPVLCAFSGDAVMQEAAARWLTDGPPEGAAT